MYWGLFRGEPRCGGGELAEDVALCSASGGCLRMIPARAAAGPEDGATSISGLDGRTAVFRGGK